MADTTIPAPIAELARAARRVVFFTGAGMSAESGLDTFRDAGTGLWSHVDPQAMASFDAWRADPAPIWPWYLERLRRARAAAPNAGHRAVAGWSRRLAAAGGSGSVVTQNIDDLHERAGSTGVAHLHGRLDEFRCDHCAAPAPEPVPPEEPTAHLMPPFCAACGTGFVRPAVTWFGEALPAAAWAAAERAIGEADLVVVVGTSGVVFPAAGLPLQAMHAGVPVVELSPADTDLTPALTASWRTTAATGLPALAGRAIAALDAAGGAPAAD